MLWKETKLNRSKQNREEGNGRVKLNKEIVLKIREDYKNGIKTIDLANKYNVQKPCIWKIVHRYTWKYI